MEHIHAATSVRDALYQISKKSKVHIHAASVAAAKQVLPLLCWPYQRRDDALMLFLLAWNGDEKLQQMQEIPVEQKQYQDQSAFLITLLCMTNNNNLPN